MRLQPRIDEGLQTAVKHFWNTRETQAQRQGALSGTKDAGNRSAVTGGAQMNGFINLVRDLLRDTGLSEAYIHCKKRLELPG